jgi:hypothetical protein
MLGRRIAVVRKPDQRPDAAENAEQVEDVAPLEARHHQHDQRRTDSAAETRACVLESLSPRALPGRQPRHQRARRRRERRRLAGSEKAARERERHGAAGQAGNRGEQRPPGNRHREHDARPEAIGEPAARHLQERVRPVEGRGGPAHRDLVEAEFGHDRRRRRPHHRPIDVHDEGDDERDAEHDVPGSRGRHSRRFNVCARG